MRITSRKENYKRVNRYKEFYYSYPTATRIRFLNMLDNVIIKTDSTEGNQSVQVSLNKQECLALLEVINAMLDGKDLDAEIELG